MLLSFSEDYNRAIIKRNSLNLFRFMFSYLNLIISILTTFNVVYVG